MAAPRLYKDICPYSMKAGRHLQWVPRADYNKVSGALFFQPKPKTKPPTKPKPEFGEQTSSNKFESWDNF